MERYVTQRTPVSGKDNQKLGVIRRVIDYVRTMNYLYVTYFLITPMNRLYLPVPKGPGGTESL